MSHLQRVTMTFHARVPDDAGPHEIADAIRWHVDLSDLTFEDLDVSAVQIETAREVDTDRIRAAISDAYYDARDAGRTMEVAADDATLAVMKILVADPQN